jgi:hypothetical protein
VVSSEDVVVENSGKCVAGECVDVVKDDVMGSSRRSMKDNMAEP